MQERSGLGKPMALTIVSEGVAVMQRVVTNKNDNGGNVDLEAPEHPVCHLWLASWSVVRVSQLKVSNTLVVVVRVPGVAAAEQAIRAVAALEQAAERAARPRVGFWRALWQGLGHLRQQMAAATPAQAAAYGAAQAIGQ